MIRTCRDDPYYAPPTKRYYERPRIVARPRNKDRGLPVGVRYWIRYGRAWEKGIE